MIFQLKKQPHKRPTPASTTVKGIARLVILSIVIASLSGCASFFRKPQPLSHTVSPGNGVEVMQVKFSFAPKSAALSRWGRISVDPESLAAATGIEGGYLNLVSKKGWAVRNLPVPPPDQPAVAAYFDLGTEETGEMIKEIELKLRYFNHPAGDVRLMVEHDDYNRFPVTIWVWNAKGAGPTFKVDPGPPPATVPKGSAMPVGQETFAYYQQITNQQAANDQCVPMALANSLQFLENDGVLVVPHKHSAGLKGDKTLVGKLDTTCNRPVTNRKKGVGVCFKPMVDGKFKYLKDNKLSGTLNHRHQGRGWCKPLPTGNYVSHGSTSQDDGAVPTWNWIYQRLKNGCDIEAVFSYEDVKGNITGGHAVRITGGGMVTGQEWVRYSHDAQQTDVDTSDTQGLESVVVWPADLDNDGLLNFDVQWRELRFVFAECP